MKKQSAEMPTVFFEFGFEFEKIYKSGAIGRLLALCCAVKFAGGGAFGSYILTFGQSYICLTASYIPGKPRVIFDFVELEQGCKVNYIMRLTAS